MSTATVPLCNPVRRYKSGPKKGQFMPARGSGTKKKKSGTRKRPRRNASGPPAVLAAVNPSPKKRPAKPRAKPRRNPPDAIGAAQDAIPVALGVGGGFIMVRWSTNEVLRMLGEENEGLWGYVGDGVLTVAGYALLRGISKPVAEGWLIGGGVQMAVRAFTQLLPEAADDIGLSRQPSRGGGRLSRLRRRRAA